MGRAKWSVELAGKPLLRYSIDALSGCNNVSLSVASAPSMRPASFGLPLLIDTADYQGPVQGLLAAITQLPGDESPVTFDKVAVLTCDVPFIERSHVDRLLGAMRSGDEAVIARSSGRIHPGIAIYRYEAILALARSIPPWLRRFDDLTLALRCRFVDIPEAAAFNVNTPLDLATAEDLLSNH